MNSALMATLTRAEHHQPPLAAGPRTRHVRAPSASHPGLLPPPMSVAQPLCSRSLNLLKAQVQETPEDAPTLDPLKSFSESAKADFKNALARDPLSYRGKPQATTSRPH